MNEDLQAILKSKIPRSVGVFVSYDNFYKNYMVHLSHRGKYEIYRLNEELVNEGDFNLLISFNKIYEISESMIKEAESEEDD